ncbi:hypothetical protein Tco_0775293 [Tanacetum coccineum]
MLGMCYIMIIDDDTEVEDEVEDDIEDDTMVHNENVDIVVHETTSASNEGLAECKVSASNFRRIQVTDIVKEVEDYLKTYSSAGMDIS